MDDSAVREALATGLDRGFEQLVLLYQDRLYRFALRLAGNSQDAEEIAQDAFVRAYGALQSYAPDRIRALAPRPWLYQIALNVFRNRVRRRHLPEAPLFLDDSIDDRASADEPRADERDGPEFVVLDGERRSELTVLLARLPERHRVVVILRHVEGLSYGELAVILNQPVGTIKANVHRGVAALRNALTQSQDAVSNESTQQIAVSSVSENPANVSGVGRRTRSPEGVT